MEKIKKIITPVFLFSVIVAVYHTWFMPGILTGGDFGMTFPSMYLNEYIYPYAWYWNQGNALGGDATSLLWIYFKYGIADFIFGKILALPWGLFERFAYFYPFLLIGTISSIMLGRYVFSKKIYAVLSAFIFLVNTYVLMVAEGGQIWILLAYSLSPLALYLFMKTIDADYSKRIIKLAILTGLVFSSLLMLEVRTAFIILVAAFMYWFLINLRIKTRANLLKTFIFAFIIPGIISVGLHAFWLVPTVILRQNPANLGSAYSATVQSVEFLSFAKLENTISLLHPNWPENIFGYVHFMRPEFLLLPVLAFSSLLFLRQKTKYQKSKPQIKNEIIIFFALLGILGAFLAKGSNEPFGVINLWLFSYIPGFVMFRDPTKWYALVAIAYSILIPFSVWNIYEFIKLHQKFSIKSKILNFQNLFVLFVVLYVAFLARPAFSGQLSGNFKPTVVPKDYIVFENYLSSQKSFSRVLWTPQFQRFGLSSITHPAMSAEGFYGKYDIQQVLDQLKKEKARRILTESAIKYVVVPYDTNGEIYVKDRKYDSSQYLKTLSEVSQLSYLKKVDGFGKIGVYEVVGAKEHFWSPSSSLHISYQYISPVKSLVTVKNAQKGDVVVFAESYNSKWIATTGTTQIHSTQYDNLFNSFILPKNGNYELEVYYTPQHYVETGFVISIITCGLIIVFLILSFKNKNK